MKAILTLMLLLAGMTCTWAAVDVQHMTPKEASIYVDTNIDDPKTQGVIDLMIEKIHKEKVTPVSEELAFLMDVCNFDMWHETKLKNVQKLLDILTEKYAGNIDVTMQLLMQ